MVRRLVLTLGCIVLLPLVAGAQSAISGTVRDTTGGVLPGVTVEAASPALIEGSRVAVTDGQGVYRIIDLRPGAYTVTFSLAGFNTVLREGIELTTNFTANVDAELRVGAIEETITVSGASPVVDVQSATTQQVLTREVLDAVPTGRNLWGIGATLTGVTLSAPDVGGTAGMQQTYMAVHGSSTRDNAIQVDGMSVNGIEGDGAIQNYFNEGMFEEMSYQTSALGAEVQGSGVRLNMIPKEGGNIFSGTMFTRWTLGDWQSNNFTDELKATGLRAPNRVDLIHDTNPSVGGPILRDRLWFFSSVRFWGLDQKVTESFYNLDPTRRTYVPDLSHQTVDDNLIKSFMTRLTMTTGKHKLAAYLDRIIKFRGHECGAFTAEEACGVRNPKRYFTAQAKYTGTLSSRLLVEGGWSENDETYSSAEPQPSVKATDIGRTDRDTTESWTDTNGPYYFRVPDRHTFTASLSYVTGSHAFKGGMQLGKGGNQHFRELRGGLGLSQEYRSANRPALTPVSVITYMTPQMAKEQIKYDLGIYLQDSWTLKRLTMNPGIRFELFNTYIPAQSAPAGRFVPARSFDKIENMPNWKDVAPRVAAVFDVFGDGRTALKGNVGKYVIAYSTVGFAQVYNPMVYATDRRTWTDRNGDDIAQDSEIGPVNNPFNIRGVSNRNPDPDIKRPYQYEYSLGIQQEVRPGVSVSFNWVRRDYRRLIWTENLLVPHSAYTIVNVPNPIKPSETIPIYNLNRDRLGLVNRLDRNSENNRRWFNAFDAGFNARIPNGTIFGGVSTGKQTLVICDVENPNSLRFCDERLLDIPYLTQIKLSWAYRLPYEVQFSGNWQGYPGSPTGSQSGNDMSLSVNYVVDRTVVPTLTQSSVTVPLIEPGTKYLERWNQLDFRLAKRFTLGNVRLQGQLDIFNVLNSSSILNQLQTYGPTLDRPSAILQGRLFGVGMQVNF